MGLLYLNNNWKFFVEQKNYKKLKENTDFYQDFKVTYG
jgi:hypothetical protein